MNHYERGHYPPSADDLSSNGTPPSGLRRVKWLLVPMLVLSASAFAFVMWPYPSERGRLSPLTQPAPRSPRLDDSGFGAVKNFAVQIKNPLSLESIRSSYLNAGGRAVEALEQELSANRYPAALLLDKYVALGQLHLYDGRFPAAAEALARARAIIEGDRERFGGRLATIIFLQGVTALRRGETENCVECQNESSCIYPIAATAMHEHRAGSAEAIGFFKEYLELCPEDVGVRWLLSVATMTIGEYPAAVPTAYRLPLERFASGAAMPRMVDVAARAGVNRLHQAGGAIMDDFDGDDRLDIVETTWDATSTLAFFHNRGDGTFEDRTAQARLVEQFGGLYCVQADYNNDGWLDLVICRGAWTGVPQRPSLLRNNGDGAFTDVTREAGLLKAIDSQVAAWADYDNDGWLDLFLGGETVRNRLYRNRRDGTFEDVARQAGMVHTGLICKGANWGDFDGDGDPDLYISNLNGPNQLFQNDGLGGFVDVAPAMGVTEPRVSFSCWFWDYDNDGQLDLLVNSYDPTLTEVVKSMLRLSHGAETTRLYRNQGKRFVDVSVAAGVDVAAAPMGSNFADFDGDGFLDFYLGTGDPKYSMLVPNRMFKNLDGRRFADVTVASGTGHLQKGHGVACGDWDGDGDVDLFEQLGGATPGDSFRNVLFQNPGNGNHWLTVRLVGRTSNRSAIGARIKVTLAGTPPRVIHRHVTSGSSFGANPLRQTIGLGSAQRIQTLEVYWPTSKTIQTYTDLSGDAHIEITEGAAGFRKL